MMSTLLTGPLATLTLSLAAWFALVNVLTLTVFYVDDRRAAAGDWGVPDKTLLLLALIGGWPGAKLSQLIFRHGSTRRGFRTLLNLSILPMLGLVGYFATQGMDWAAFSDQATAKVMAMLGQAPTEPTGPTKPTVLVMGKSSAAGGTGPLAMQFGTSKTKPAGAWKPANAHPSLNLTTALPLE